MAPSTTDSSHPETSATQTSSAAAGTTSPSPKSHDTIIVPSSTVTSPSPSILDGLRTIRREDFASVHKAPCARDGFLTGIGLGFGAGGIRFVLGGSQWRSLHWALGTFCLASVLGFEFCQRRRNLEKASIARVNEAIKRKNEEKEREMGRRKEEVEAKRRRREDDERRERDKQNGWSLWGGKGKDGE